LYRAKTIIMLKILTVIVLNNTNSSWGLCG